MFELPLDSQYIYKLSLLCHRGHVSRGRVSSCARWVAICSSSSLAAKRREEARRQFWTAMDAYFGVVHSFQVGYGVHEVARGNKNEERIMVGG